MEIGQVIEYNNWKGRFFFKNHSENEAERLVPDLFLLFKKALYEVKVVICNILV